MNIEEDKDKEEPDVGGIRRLFRTRSFDKTVFDIRKVPPDLIAVSVGQPLTLPATDWWWCPDVIVGQEGGVGGRVIILYV